MITLLGAISAWSDLQRKVVAEGSSLQRLTLTVCWSVYMRIRA